MYIFLMRFIYFIHIIQVFSFVCVLTWSLKAWATPRSVSFRALIKISDEHPHPFHMLSLPPPPPPSGKKVAVVDQRGSH